LPVKCNQIVQIKVDQCASKGIKKEPAGEPEIFIPEQYPVTFILHGGIIEPATNTGHHDISYHFSVAVEHLRSLQKKKISDSKKKKTEGRHFQRSAEFHEVGIVTEYPHGEAYGNHLHVVIKPMVCLLKIMRNIPGIDFHNESQYE
jgi:hypothetical protein